jgi:hypothetical protein
MHILDDPNDPSNPRWKIIDARIRDIKIWQFNNNNLAIKRLTNKLTKSQANKNKSYRAELTKSKQV